MKEELECLEAIYQGKLWDASILKIREDTYDEELRLFMRKESQARKFFCPECMENLILNAGNIRQPYFRHYDGSECIMASAAGYTRGFYTRERLKHLAERSFPKAVIQVYAPLPNTKYRSQILIEDLHCKMALNYVPDGSRIERIEEMSEAMAENGIIPVWFCQYSTRNFEKMTTIQYLIQKMSPILKFIDLRDSRLYLKRYQYEKGKEHLIYSDYLLVGQVLGFSGEFVNDFEKPKSGIYEKVITGLGVNRSRDIAYGEKIYYFLDEQGMLLSEMTNSIQKDVIERVSHDASGKNMELGALYMKNREEDWFLKKMKGNPKDRTQALAIRRALMYYLDEAFEGQIDELLKVVSIISEMTDASQWILLSDLLE